jgi:hypothetical protein
MALSTKPIPCRVIKWKGIRILPRPSRDEAHKLEINARLVVKETYDNLINYITKLSPRRICKNLFGCQNQCPLKQMIEVKRPFKSALKPTVKYCSHDIPNAMTRRLNSQIPSIQFVMQGFSTLVNWRRGILLLSE